MSAFTKLICLTELSVLTKISDIITCTAIWGITSSDDRLPRVHERAYFVADRLGCRLSDADMSSVVPLGMEQTGPGDHIQFDVHWLTDKATYSLTSMS